jgi:hypothetical protein
MAAKKVVGEASGKKVMLTEALQDALDNAPPPVKADIQRLELLAVELAKGGFTNLTTTRVTLQVKPFRSASKK